MADTKKLHTCFLRYRQFLLFILSRWDRILTCLLTLMIVCGIVYRCQKYTSPDEMAVRQELAETARTYLGCKESDGSHKRIIDFYNSQEILPREYEVTYEDSWCAVFTSVVAMEMALTDILPVECSCEQQIQLFDAAGRWIEEDCYLPKPGDYIYYDWQYATKKDSRGWSDHVGIVAEVFGPVMKVIEGNKDDTVTYRYLFLNDPTIRGFGIPDYSQVTTHSK